MKGFYDDDLVRSLIRCNCIRENSWLEVTHHRDSFEPPTQPTRQVCSGLVCTC